MKIIHITASYKPAYIYGGPIMSVAKLCEALVVERIKEQGSRNKEQGIRSTDGSTTTDEHRTKDNELLVFTTTANGKTELPVERVTEQSIDGVQVKFFKRLTKDHSHFSPSLLFSLARELRHSNTDKIPTVVHIHAWWNLVSVLSCLIAKMSNIPVLLSPRGMLTSYTFGNRNAKSKNLLHFILGKKLLKYCHIHATSEQEKHDILKVVIPKSITVIPNLVDLGTRSKEQGTKSREQGTKTKDQRPKSNEQGLKSKDDQQTTKNERQSTIDEQQPFKIIFLSRIEEKKGLEILLEALAQTEFDWSLTIAGSGEENYVDSLKLKVESLKLTEQISWVGQVKNEQKFQLLADHDLLALVSYNENFANVVIESLSVGTPVLLSEHVGLADYVKENKFGWVTEIKIHSTADSIKVAHEDFEYRTHIRKNAPNQITKDFDSPNLAKRYLELYQKLTHE